jgi:hypothetical protein
LEEAVESQISFCFLFDRIKKEQQKKEKNDFQ